MSRGQPERPGNHRTKEHEKKPGEARKNQTEPIQPERAQGPRRHQREQVEIKSQREDKRNQRRGSQGEARRAAEHPHGKNVAMNFQTAGKGE